MKDEFSILNNVFLIFKRLNENETITLYSSSSIPNFLSYRPTKKKKKFEKKIEPNKF